MQNVSFVSKQRLVNVVLSFGVFALACNCCCGLHVLYPFHSRMNNCVNVFLNFVTCLCSDMYFLLYEHGFIRASKQVMKIIFQTQEEPWCLRQNPSWGWKRSQLNSATRWWQKPVSFSNFGEQELRSLGPTSRNPEFCTPFYPPLAICRSSSPVTLNPKASCLMSYHLPAPRRVLIAN